MSTTRIALVQMRSGRSVVANVEAAAELITEAAGAGATYIQTPEMTTLIERDRERVASEVTDLSTQFAVERFAGLAESLGVVLHIGSMAVPLEDGRFGNRAHLFGPDGTLAAIYDKIHMFDVDLDNGESWRESAVYAPGEHALVVKTSFASIGLGICYDLRFASLFRAQAQAGAEIIGTPAAFTRQTGEAHWHILQRARAIETGSFVASAAQGGTHDDERETFGHSIIVSPWGDVLAEKADDEPGILVADIDLGDVVAARKKIPALKHDRKFALIEADTEADESGTLSVA